MDDSQRRFALAAGALVVALVLVGAVVALGAGPFGGENDSDFVGDGGADGTTQTPPPTGTVYTDMSGGDGTATQPPFTFEIVRIEQCGQTCRDVTVTLYNNQNETATNVSVFTRIYAGNSTAGDDKVWEGTKDVGEMASDSSVTRTQRVKLSTTEGFQVQQNDGWITLLVTVSSSDTTITFKERRNVT